jgi:hypothetical protein
MPRAAAAPLDRTAAVAGEFATIGTGVRIRDVQDKAAWEYWAASALLGLAEKRRDKAKKQAVAAAVIPNYADDPMPIGTAETVYSGAQVRIDVKVVEQATRVDVAALVIDLERAGVKLATLRRLVKKHTRTFNGAHILTASLVGVTTDHGFISSTSTSGSFMMHKKPMP